MLQPIEVFRAGKHRATNGKVYEFTEAQVAEIASSYDPAVMAAPIVLGHPKTDDPAWGWAKVLTLNDAGVIVAEPEKVDPAFAEGVDAGRYRYVSASLYAPQDPSNPKPGSWYLRHIGFLGAQPPAVKGLQPAFAEELAELVTFAAADADTVQSLFRGLRDWMIEKDGIDAADKVLPGWLIDGLEIYQPAAGADFAEGDSTTTAAAGGDTVAGAAAADTLVGGQGADTITGGTAEAAFAARHAELDAREAEIASREAAFAEGRRADARSEDGVFLDGLVAEGRLPPTQRDRVAAIFARLDGDETLAFAEAEADPRAELRDLLSSLGVSIQFAEFSAGDGFDGQADPQRVASEITRIVSEHRARGEEISYSAAASLVGR